MSERSRFPAQFPAEHALGEPISYPDGFELFRQGRPLRTLYYIVEGRVRLSAAREGGRLVPLGDRHEGWLLGVGPAGRDAPTHWSSAHARGHCLLRALTLSDFLKIRRVNPEVTEWALEQLARDLEKQVLAATAFGGRPPERIAWYFADQAGAGSTRTPNGALLIHDTPTQSEIAEAIGVTRQYVRDLLDEMEIGGDIGRPKARRYVIPRGSRILHLVASNGE